MEEMNERLDKLKKGLESINGQIAALESEIRRLVAMRNAQEGAIIELKYWIEKNEPEPEPILSEVK